MKNSRPSQHAQLILASIFLLALTPGRLSAQTSALAFNHNSGFFQSAFHLSLSTSVEGAIIYFTTNGALPSPATGLRYTDTVPIATTTIVRAAAFDRGKPASDVITRCYLFRAAVSRQSGGQLPRDWGAIGSQAIPANYEMAATADVATQQTLTEALGTIPSLSLVTDPANLFSQTSGIYLHPTQRGADWERPASVELIETNDTSRFQINCGVRIHGGMSRRPEESPKHSFRLTFKRRYGPAKLRNPILGPDGPQEFDELVLRAGSNDSWLDSNGKQRGQAAYVRDEWMRGSMRAMGHPSARGIFVHLYLNGLYWGVYNVCERPGGSLLAGQGDAAAAGYDVRKGDETESGDSVVWRRLMALANSSVSDDQSFQGMSELVDLPQLVDYLILNFYAGNSDWDRSANWYAIRPRIAGGKFQFLVWDGERTLENLAANTLDLDDDESPLRLFHKLSESAAFRARFARRARELLFDDGALAPEPAAKRFRALADSIAKPLLAESARWGSYRRDMHPYKTGPYEFYTVKDHWQPEVERILTRHFPQRREIVLKQFEERGLFPSHSAPSPN